MSTKNRDTSEVKKTSAFLKELREFALTLNEECPEGHRRDVASGACLPLGSIDYTAFTRSLNVDDGPFWRGEVEKTQTPLVSQANRENAVDASEMQERSSCPQGTTFSFIQERCISLEEAMAEDNDPYAMNEDGSYVEVAMPMPVPPLGSDEKPKVFGRVAVTARDPMDGHRHLATVDTEGKGVTSMAGFPEHSHNVSEFMVEEARLEHNGEEYVSRHPGPVTMQQAEVELELAAQEEALSEQAAPITTKQRNRLPDSAFGVPGKRKFPLDTCARVRNAMARFNQAKGLTPAEKAQLRRRILARARECGISVRNFAKAQTSAEFDTVVQELLPAATVNRVMQSYAAQHDTCPPGMVWDPSAKRCVKSRAFVEDILGRKLGAQLVPNPEGRPAKLPVDCPEGTIWHGGLQKCIPLSSEDKTKAAETAQARPGNREGLTPPPAGQVKLPQDCPPGTAWDADLRACRPLDTREKVRPGNTQQNPKSIAAIISKLDDIIRTEVQKGRRDRAKVSAKELPDAAFPPSLVTGTRRALMHHTPDVEDPYDHDSVDVARLRNSLARISVVEGFSEKAKQDALDHLLFHAQEVIDKHSGKS